MRQFSAAADAILDECKTHVAAGLGDKLLGEPAESLLRATFKPKIVRRLAPPFNGNWEAEKTNPLIVAEHLGQICAILTVGSTVSAAIAQAAAAAARKDEHCTISGGGAGDWCF